MNIIRVNGIKIEGVVACLPSLTLDNASECRDLFGDNVNTLIKATGIQKRCIAPRGVSSLDLCCLAAEKLMKSTNTKPEEIGAVVFVTFTPEYLMPCNAIGAQDRLGLPRETAAFDVGLACSGYVYGLWLGAIAAKSYNKKILLLDGDVQSAYVSQTDKSTMPVMADAGTASLISPCAKCCDNEWIFSFFSDGSRREALYIKAGGSKCPITEEDLKIIPQEDGGGRRNADIYMDGFEIFKFVAQDVTRFLQQFITKADESADSIDLFVPHQANLYMISQLTRKLKFNQEKMWKSCDCYGNSASATIPVTIAENALKYFKDLRQVKVLVSGFGGGLSVGAGLIYLDPDAVYQVIRY